MDVHVRFVPDSDYLYIYIPGLFFRFLFQCGSLYFCVTAEISQRETLVGHGAAVSPLLSHRSNRVLSVTVTGEGFPTLVVPSVKGALVSI